MFLGSCHTVFCTISYGDERRHLFCSTFSYSRSCGFSHPRLFSYFLSPISPERKFHSVHQKLCLRFSQPALGLYRGVALPQDAALCPFSSACPHVPEEQRSQGDAHGVLVFSVYTQEKRTASRPGGCRVRRGGPGCRLTGSVIAYMLSLIPSALFQVSVRGQAHFSSFFSHPAIRAQKGNSILCLCCSAYLFILVISLFLHYSYSVSRHINL